MKRMKTYGKQSNYLRLYSVYVGNQLEVHYKLAKDGGKHVYIIVINN